MAVETNGRAVESGLKGANGHAQNGHAISAPTPSSKFSSTTRRKSLGLFSIISRLITWYSIITILFRCPSTVDQLTSTSPKICKPFFQSWSILAPHLEPYYKTYAAPYVDTARPYYNTLEKNVITPATALGIKYGAPRVAQAQAFGQAQWEKNLQPQVAKYQGLAQARYGQTLAPHVNSIVEATNPYYEIAKDSAFQTYYGHVVPSYTAIQPYAIQGYGLASDFTLNTLVPYSRWAWTTGAIFLDRTVWPKLRILYGENVEPQLVRIGERLGRYRDGKKLKAAVDDIDISASSSSASSSISSISSSVSSAYATTTATSSASSSMTVEASVAPEETPLSEKQIRAKAQVIVSNDLKLWQEKFAKAADEGSEELEQRITEITDRVIQSQADGVGKALLIQLEETTASSLKTLKTNIIAIVRSTKGGDDSTEALNLAVRKAGAAIKDKAQAIRTWRRKYDDETNSLVNKASEDTFEIIDHIRDLGLQEIGMRWAWTDGITHKDWSKYHQLKTKFDEWRIDVERVVTDHPGLTSARASSQAVENKAMGIAEEAAKELARIKEVGNWKLSAGDSSNDFSVKVIPAVVAHAGQKIIQQVSEASAAIAGTTQGSLDSIASVASATASSIASEASNSIVGTQQGPIESVASVAKASARVVADQASNVVVGTSQGTLESVLSVVKNSGNSMAEKASSSVIGTSQGIVESVISNAGERAKSVSAEASSSIIGEEPGFIAQASASIDSAGSKFSASASSLSDAASSSISSGSSILQSASSSVASSLSKEAVVTSSSVSSSASSASTAASKKVWGGAMAQHVEARKIIFEDIVEDADDSKFTEKLQSLASEAGDRYADITRAVSEALLKPTSTDKYTPVTKLAAEQYSSALAAASIALYGTEKGTGESVTSLVASRYSEAVLAASSIIYGTPIPVTDSIAAKASDAYNNALSLASGQYAHARSLVSAQISGTPQPAHQEVLNSAESAYSDSINAASSVLQAALSSISTAVYGTPTPSYQAALSSLSAVAQSRLSEGLAEASKRFEEGKSYVDAINTGSGQKQRLLAQMRDQYYAGIGMAHAQYTEFVSVASSAILPTQTPSHESLYNRASVGIVGTPTAQYQGALSTASSEVAFAISAASSSLESALAAVTGTKKTDVAAIAAASSQYRNAVIKASESYESLQSMLQEKYEKATLAASSAVYGSDPPFTESIASAASSAVYGSETPWSESAASAASANWEALITKASEQIYGSATPYFVTRRLISEVQEYAAQATQNVQSNVQAQYSAVNKLIVELISGKEPAFTQSVYTRLSSAYFTGAADAVSSASSYASVAYESASSAVSSVFTPPPALEAILDTASARLNDVVEAASIQFYGSQKGTYEQATEAASSAYSSIQSVASEKVYGSQVGYAEAAQTSISDAISSAQKAISEAIYGTKTGAVESAASVVGDTYTGATSIIAENLVSATSVVGEHISAAQAAISTAIYGPEKGAVESAQARLNAAVESARSKLAEFAASAGDGASEAVAKASEGVEQFANSVSSVVVSATARARDEL